MHPEDRSNSHHTGPDDTCLYYDRSLHRDIAVLRNAYSSLNLPQPGSGA